MELRNLKLTATVIDSYQRQIEIYAEIEFFRLVLVKFSTEMVIQYQ